MRNAFEQRVSDVNRRKQSEQDEEGAMVSVVVSLIVSGKIDVGFSRKKQDRRQIQNCWRDQHKNEKKKPPRLLVTPTVEDPPRDYEVQEKVNNPDNVDPVNATMGACLQHLADAAQHSRHAQGENDGDEDGEILECIHRLRNG